LRTAAAQNKKIVPNSVPLLFDTIVKLYEKLKNLKKAKKTLDFMSEKCYYV